MTTKGIVENSLKEAIAERLRALRIAGGASQTQMAAAMCVTVTQYQKYEYGQNRIACCRAVLVCKFLKIPITDLLANLKLKRK